MVVQVNDVGMELRAKDLRIGNIINYDTAEGDVLPTTIDWQDLKWISEDQKGFNLCHSPIPLTEEILLKCGFDFDKENEALNIFVNGLKITIIDKLGKWMIYLSGPFGMVILNSIKHLHELQNLFNSLSGGQELNVKL